ncbi:MAG: hypothetical protein Ct9H90mP13_11620 [Pseudomonadota bacterium]|nr:MAG: hypothetical protein Ct9H90mP13_11620 [Pseudomonadota bacterium]
MGAHERFNDFSVDGVSFNDPFGLNDNGFGSMRKPISMEFVDQISVDITPYDVSRGNTTADRLQQLQNRDPMISMEAYSSLSVMKMMSVNFLVKILQNSLKRPKVLLSVDQSLKTNYSFS